MVKQLRVRDKYQITLPAPVCRILPLRIGDYVICKRVPEGLLLQPRQLVYPLQRGQTLIDLLEGSRSRRPLPSVVD